MPTISKSIENFLNKVVDAIKQDQLRKGMVASGKSANSLRIEFDNDGGKIYGSNYFKFQERGRGPGKAPPVQNIIDWINSKAITPENNGSVEGMAFAIAKKIAAKGTDIFEGKREGLDIAEFVQQERRSLSEELLKGTRERIIKVIV